MAGKGKSPPVFRPAKAKEWNQNAVVGWSHKPEYLYEWGYARAAETLAEKAIAGGEQDILFYPICFLYRHALEIALKNLIRDADRDARQALSIAVLPSSRERSAGGGRGQQETLLGLRQKRSAEV